MPSASDSVKLSWPFPNDRTISLGTSSHASAQRHCDSANQSQCFTNRSRNIQRGNFGHLKFESRDPAENSSRRRRIPFESRLCTSVLFRKAPHTRAFLQTARILRFRLNAWLGREDSNLRMAESKSAALPLGDAPTRADHSLRGPPPQPARRCEGGGNSLAGGHGARYKAALRAACRFFGSSACVGSECSAAW